MSEKTLSFSACVKRELLKIKPSVLAEKIAETHGFVFSLRDLTEEVLFTCEDTNLINLVAERLKAQTGVETFVETRAFKRSDKKALFLLKIKNPAEKTRLIDFLDSENAHSAHVARGTDSNAAFLRGAFLVCATVTNPSKEYRIEFILPREDCARALQSVLLNVENLTLAPKIIARKGAFIVYFKGNEPVADFLTYIGAPLAAMEVIQVKMLKEVRNYVNRTTNFETANLNKLAAASATQITKIELIAREKGLDWLPEKLREIARLRLENPDMSLKELGNSLSVPLSRSGVSHRLNKIMQLAEKVLGDLDNT